MNCFFFLFRRRYRLPGTAIPVHICVWAVWAVWAYSMKGEYHCCVSSRGCRVLLALLFAAIMWCSCPSQRREYTILLLQGYMIRPRGRNCIPVHAIHANVTIFNAGCRTNEYSLQGRSVCSEKVSLPSILVYWLRIRGAWVVSRSRFDWSFYEIRT